MRIVVVASVSLIALLAINFQIWQKERLLESGRVVYLPLAPVDPRSIMQGDYMILRYQVPRKLRNQIIRQAKQGVLLLKLDDKKIATIDSEFMPGDTQPPDTILLQYKVRNRRIRLGSGAFFFQEGHAKYYNNAKYGEIRISKNGKSVLVGLRDTNLKLLGPAVDHVHVTE